MDNLTLGSLFDGSGGFPLGGILAGITPVFSSEIEPFPIRVTTKRMPFIKHYGDVSSINGGEIEPVDIITFGSPCQDMSVAGKRSGLDGERSSLFYEAIRIIKEMRKATNGKYPRFIVWENVPGAFSSNKGNDFKAVLEEICKIKDEHLSVPKAERWTNSGEIVAENFSLAWRVLDAQYWGVPQRRKRIFLVADFADECAGKILFESEGVSGYSAQGFRSWQGTAGGFEKSINATGIDGYNGSLTGDVSSTLGINCGMSTGRNGIVLNDQGGERMDVTEDVTSTLRAEAHHPPCIVDSAGFCTEHSAKARGIGYEKEKSPTLRTGTIPAAVYENHSQDTRYTGPLDTAPTVLSTYGTGGNNQPFVVDGTKSFDVRLTSDGTKNARHNVYETDTSRTIDTGGNFPESNQGGVAVVESYSIQGNMIGRDDKNGPQGKGVNKDVSFTLNATDKHAVAYGIDRAAFNQGKNAKYDFAVTEELQPTMVAKGPGAVQSGYTVRRLTPTECARLQGFPDWWCANLGTEKPSDEELYFWYKVFETHRLATNPNKKPKTSKQILKWLKDPHSDSAKYKMWGNGVALPCVYFILSGIVYYSQSEDS